MTPVISAKDAATRSTKALDKIYEETWKLIDEEIKSRADRGFFDATLWFDTNTKNIILDMYRDQLTEEGYFVGNGKGNQLTIQWEE